MKDTSLYSAVIIAKNEARTIGQCIIALQKVTDDIIIVLDDRSEDETESIASGLGAKVLKKSWEGYSINKNFGVDQSKHNWIICVDADEIIDETLAENLRLLSPQEDSVYYVNILTYLGQKSVKHCGWFPDWNIRLFNKNIMRWNQNFVHEKLVSNHILKKRKIQGLIHHYSFRDEAHMKEKYLYYAHLRANEWKNSGTPPPLIKQIFGPYYRFFRTYFLKRGFLDGYTGIVIANNEFILKKNELRFYKTQF